jgi:hypothetical protein
LDSSCILLNDPLVFIGTIAVFVAYPSFTSYFPAFF